MRFAAHCCEYSSGTGCNCVAGPPSPLLRTWQDTSSNKAIAFDLLDILMFAAAVSSALLLSIQTASTARSCAARTATRAFMSLLSVKY
jgi:hypothetical protein